MARTRDEEAFKAKQKEILRAAESLFVEQGFHQTGMAAICDAAEMSPGTLYRYFESKADIIQAFAEEEKAETEELFEYLANARDFKKALVDGLLEVIEEVSDETYGRVALEIAAEGARDESIGSVLEAAEQDMQERFIEIIKDAQSRGDINQDCDAQACAYVLTTLINGATGASLAPLSKRKLKSVLSDVVDGMFGAA